MEIPEKKNKKKGMIKGLKWLVKWVWVPIILVLIPVVYQNWPPESENDIEQLPLFTVELQQAKFYLLSENETGESTWLAVFTFKFLPSPKSGPQFDIVAGWSSLSDTSHPNHDETKSALAIGPCDINENGCIIRWTWNSNPRMPIRLTGGGMGVTKNWAVKLPKKVTHLHVEAQFYQREAGEDYLCEVDSTKYNLKDGLMYFRVVDREGELTKKNCVDFHNVWHFKWPDDPNAQPLP